MPRGTVPLPEGAEHVTHHRLGPARVHPRRCGRRVVLHRQDRFDPRARHNAVQLAQELPVLDPLSVGQAAAPQIPATVKRIQEYSVAAHGMPRFAGPCAHGCHHVGETLRAQILRQRYGGRRELPAPHFHEVAVLTRDVDPVRPRLPVQTDRQEHEFNAVQAPRLGYFCGQCPLVDGGLVDHGHQHSRASAGLAIRFRSGEALVSPAHLPHHPRTAREGREPHLPNQSATGSPVRRYAPQRAPPRPTSHACAKRPRTPFKPGVASNPVGSLVRGRRPPG